MSDIPNIADINASFSKQDKTLQESAANLGTIILEMERDRQCYGKHTRRLARLKKLAVLQEAVVRRMLDRGLEESQQRKRPPLRVVK